MKNKVLQLFALLIYALAVFTINSTCYLGLGQEKEPESLKKLKKINK